MITQPTDIPSGNNIEVSGSIHESLVLDVTQSHISNQASTSSHPAPQDRWSRDQHIELVNIIGDPKEDMLTRSMASKLTVASASECLFANFLSKIEPKKEEGIENDETFAPVARMEVIRIFLAFATYMNFKVYQMDVKSAFLNGKLKEEVYVKQPPGFESSEFPDYVYKLNKALYGLKQAPRACDAIKSRFGGNDESKKMHRNVLKHQFENFTTAPNESLDKAYDRFQKLISQLEVYAAPVSKEDINQKFLRSLPPSWSQIALIMRNKPDIDQTDIDDLYNNLRVYEDEMKRSLSSTSNSQNLAFLSSENTSSTNEVSPASGNFGVNTAGGTSSSSQVSSTPGADEVVCSFFAQQKTSHPLDNEDLQQIDQDDLEELDIRWQVAMLTVRVQRFIQKTGRNLDFKGKQPVTFDKSKVECYNCHRKGHFAKECKSGRNQGKRSYGDNGRRNATTNEPSSQALNFDSEREKHSRARLEIQGYELALESLESRILGHEKNELAWGEKYEFQNYELKCREIKINNLKMELEKVVKERDELKVKIEKWEESSKGLNKILNSQMSAKDKNGLGYGTQLDEMSNKSETDSEIRNFLTPRADISFAGLDEYAIRKKIIESKTTKPKDDTSESKTSETVGLINPVRPNGKIAVHTISTTSTARPVGTARPFAPKIAQTGSAIRPIYLRMENVRPRASYSPIKRSYYTKLAFRPKNLKQDVKTSRVKNMTTARTRAIVNIGKEISNPFIANSLLKIIRLSMHLVIAMKH
ncbi:ribonuclease H-like domain-containing protein [Tanacetum coccineum]|uniref:Ribonuclease H-like domain-containing protein n=1 Tax=Tanacetum coccineum TaxID=301880 RepID=A0ABQ5D139_9ASTR